MKNNNYVLDSPVITGRRGLEFNSADLILLPSSGNSTPQLVHRAEAPILHQHEPLQKLSLDSSDLDTSNISKQSSASYDLTEDDANNSGYHTANPQPDDTLRKKACVNFDTVYLLRTRCSCLPRWLINCFFRKARLTNAYLDVGETQNEEDDEYEDEDEDEEEDEPNQLENGNIESDNDGEDSEHGDTTDYDTDDDVVDEVSHLLHQNTLIKQHQLNSQNQQQSYVSDYGSTNNRSSRSQPAFNHSSITVDGLNAYTTPTSTTTPKSTSTATSTTTTTKTSKLKKKKKRKLKDKNKDNENKKDKKVKDEFHLFRLIGLCVATAFAGVFNNITFVKMGHSMGYPAFLLYFTTFLYVLIYATWFVIRRFNLRQLKKRELEAYYERRRFLLTQSQNTLGSINGDENTSSSPSSFSSSLPWTIQSSKYSNNSNEAIIDEEDDENIDTSKSRTKNSNKTGKNDKTNHKDSTTIHMRRKISKTYLEDIQTIYELDELYLPDPVPSWSHGLFTSKLGFYYAAIGILITVGGGCSQFADPHVSGGIQAALNQLTLPLTAIFARWWLKHDFTLIEIYGAMMVFLASLLPLFPLFLSQSSIGNSIATIIGFDYQHHLDIIGPVKDASISPSLNHPFWVFIFFLSDFPSAMVNVIEEIVFTEPYCVDEIHNLTFTNLITLFGYLSLIPLDTLNPDRPYSLIELNASTWDMQKYAFQCFFHGSSPNNLPPGCLPNAWVPVIGFVGCIVIYFYIAAVVVKTESAAFQAVSSALVTPLSTLAFSSKLLMGQHALPVDEFTLLAIVFIPMGIVVYKWDDITGKNTEEDIIPLIARH